jgi:LmbE family N-acetylglucosaminyl deacetylase
MNISNKDKILIIAAHPDDEILGCGGFLSKYANQVEISIVFIAEGDSCRFDSPELTQEVLKKINHREECAREALSIFNISNIDFNRLPCGRLDRGDIIDINKIIEKKISSFKPSILLSHYSHDTNNDHRIVSRSVEMSTRPLNNHDINTFSFEILSSTEWNLHNPFKPNTFVKLSADDVNNKIKAIGLYDGEIREFPHSRSADGIKTLSQYRGMQVGVNYAEAYIANRIIIKK